MDEHHKTYCLKNNSASSIKKRTDFLLAEVFPGDYNKNNFPIYSKEDSLTYAKCPFRGEVFLPNYKPEEKVRLSFIYFLCNCIDIFPQLVDIKVESDRLDLSLYNKTLGEISNYAPPVLII